MKITAFLVFLFSLHLSAATIAQTVTLSEHKVPLEKVLNDIRKQSGYVFFYNQDWMQQSQPVDLEVKNLPLENALQECFKNQPFDYAIVNKTIVLKLKEKPTANPNVPVQAVTVTGKVVDELGNPMAGVTVKQKNRPSNGTVTDSKGSYTLSVPDNNIIICFSFIGYETQELAAKNIPAGSVIALKATSTNLREVAINKGYYFEKQELSTGDVSIVTSKEIEQQPVSDPIEALKARVPGLYIQQASGNPGSYAQIQIRGQNSIANGNDPLYIVDGVPFNSVSLSSTNPQFNSALGVPSTVFGNNVSISNMTGGLVGGLGMSPLNSLNPSDIESIEVLKDADATAIYGSRGANGVVLITTKKGYAGDTRLDANVQTGVSNVAREMNLLNTQQYLAMRSQAFANDGLSVPNIATSPSDVNYDIDGVWNTSRYTNWQKVLIGNNDNFTNAQVNVSGGNTNTQFRIGLGFNSQGTVYPGDFSDKKASGSINLTHASADQRFHLQFGSQYSYDNNKLPYSDLTQFITLAPDAPALYNTDGSLNWQVLNGSSTWWNPLAYTLWTTQSNTYNLNSNLNLDYKLLNGLNIQVNLGYHRQEMDQTTIEPATAIGPPDANDPANRSYSAANAIVNTWTINPQLNYQTKIGKGNLNLLFGGQFEEDVTNNSGYYAYNFSSDAVIDNPLAASTKGLLTFNNIDYRYASVFGRIGYDWADKYILNLTARRDGSSRFGPGKQYGDFGAIGAGWIFSKENFFKNIAWLNFGKLRVSYGTSGNDQITDYQYLSTYTTIVKTYQGITGLSPTRLDNSNFAWELDKKLEGGIDLGFLQDRMDISASYFLNRTANQLVNYPLPYITGFNTIQYNLPAVVQNTGFEVVLRTINIKNQGFTWNTSLNFTLPNNKLVAFPNLSTSPYANSLVVGDPLSISKRFNYTGLNSQTGVYTFQTSNTSGIPSSPQDQTYISPVTQKFYGGLQNSIHYKHLQLDFMIQFVKQTAINYLSYFQAPGIFNSNEPTIVLGAWQTPGQSASIQKYTSAYGTQAANAYSSAAFSSSSISDASFIRLQNVSLSYQLPDQLQHALHLKSARIYVQGQNLWTITKYLGLDPETGGLNLPPLRTMTGGIQASF